jgi:hypothetical protein
MGIRADLLLSAASAFLRGAWRLARELFHETAGALFLFFAFVGGTSAWHEWKRGSTHWLAALSGGFALVMLTLGVSSFRSARRARLR